MDTDRHLDRIPYYTRQQNNNSYYYLNIFSFQLSVVLKESGSVRLYSLCFIIRYLKSFNCRYNIIRLWFPQLSTIVEHYYGKDGNYELCVVLDAYTEDLRTRTINVTEVCVPVSKVFGNFRLLSLFERFVPAKKNRKTIHTVIFVSWGTH